MGSSNMKKRCGIFKRMCQTTFHALLRQHTWLLSSDQFLSETIGPTMVFMISVLPSQYFCLLFSLRSCSCDNFNFHLLRSLALWQLFFSFSGSLSRLLRRPQHMVNSAFILYRVLNWRSNRNVWWDRICRANELCCWLHLHRFKPNIFPVPTRASATRRPITMGSVNTLLIKANADLTWRKMRRSRLHWTPPMFSWLLLLTTVNLLFTMYSNSSSSCQSFYSFGPIKYRFE